MPKDRHLGGLTLDKHRLDELIDVMIGPGRWYLVEEFARFPAGEDRAPCLWRLNTGKPSYESVQSDYSSRGMISVLVEMLAPY